MEFHEQEELRQQPAETEAAPTVTNRKDAKKSAANKFLAYLHDLIYLLTVVILALLLLFRVVIVSGPSMNRTLLDGDYLLLLSHTFYWTPKQGDIIVASKDSFDNGEPIVKRVIATEGQQVDIDFKTGVVSVDGVALEEPYVNTPTNTFEGVTFPIVVDDGCVFVMGDNRNVSKDSRSPEIGQIDCREILGKAIFLIWPGSDRGKEERQLGRIGVLN